MPAQASLGVPGNNGKTASAATTPSIQGDAQQYQKEAERIVEEERVASEKLPLYPGLSERYQLLSKMGE